MKPNFALSLFFDKVELLHRDGAKWTSIGEVAFDTEDLPNALSSLRKKALTHDPAGLRTKLILPDEQVKFLSLPTDTAGDAGVRAALKDATPYAIDELVYEYTTVGRRTLIAAVAKETLAEAEAFAVEHRFAPVSIVAQTVVGRFDGEPFFGQTKAATGLIGPDEVVERDNLPAALVPAPPKAPTPPKVEDEPEVTTAPEVVPAKKPVPQQTADKIAEPATPPTPEDTPKPAPQTPPKAAKQPPEPPKPEAPAKPDVAAKPEVVAKPKPPVQPKTEKPEDAPVEEPVFASRARSAKIESGTLEQAVTALRTPDTPKSETRSRDVPQAVPPRAKPDPQSKVAERLARATRSNMTADRNGPVPPAAAPVPDRPKTSNTAAKAPPVATAGAGVATSPKAIAATLNPPATPPASSASGLFASRRKDTPPPPALADPGTPAAAPASTKRPRGKTVFDDQEPPQRGRPRFMLLILTAILLLFMAAVAAWASLFTEDGIAGLFGSPNSAENAADPILTAAPSDTTPLAPLTAPAFDADAVVVLPGSTDPVNTAPASPIQLATAGLPSDSGLDAEITAIPAPPVEEQAGLDPLIVTPETPRGTVLSPAEADRFYAATGVWLRAPRLPLLPRSQQLADVARASSEPAYNSIATPSDLPEYAQLFPDTALAVQLDPPAADVVFDRDARGLLVATADGTVSPYGMLIYAGQPAVVPPTRPGTPLPEPVVVPEPDPVEQAPQIAEADPVPEIDTQAVTETLEALIAENLTEIEPTTDPLPEIAIAERDARGLIVASADGTITDGLIVYAGLPSIVPPTRPGTQTPEVQDLIDDSAPDTSDVLGETETTDITPGGVSFNGLRPVVRPQEITDAAAQSPVVIAAFAGPRPPVRPSELEDAALTPEPPAAPEIDNSTVAATLAAIVAAAPDPLATATSQAVAQAVVPATRPRNFDRVVAAAQARQASTVPATTPSAPATAATTVSSASVQPTGPVPQSVASAATIESAINLRQINLIGVFGRPNDRRALVRLANGSFVRVGVGDRLDGGQVTAISDNIINYVKRGQTIALGVPG